MKSVGVISIGLLLVFSFVQGRVQEDLRIIGVQSTYTKWDLTTSTITAYSSCSNTAATTACGRKRRKRTVPLKLIGEVHSNAAELDSSVAQVDAASQAPRLDGDKREKILFTIWSTSTSTATFTYTSTDTATVVSISYGCTLASSDRILVEPACG